MIKQSIFVLFAVLLLSSIIGIWFDAIHTLALLFLNVHRLWKCPNSRTKHLLLSALSARCVFTVSVRELSALFAHSNGSKTAEKTEREPTDASTFNKRHTGHVAEVAKLALASWLTLANISVF